ncbi:hypothetical protein Trad_2801 [Truepera radiovictrix DSM 17093]|uniref:Uncharacterized protein n=1 Tax=Truepera radiovictrix (strain DSM 17093 / CIP 108686 / LMG 22925 / RQ-24) TaxID=649638 RepID=D7CV75_TRURR|nr:hypothetical protein Trad_2801 [Truepera radiovictrix DSM 17093]
MSFGPRFDIPLPLYQVLLYTVLFVGIAAMGAGIGYIISYLVHEYRQSREPKALPPERDAAPSMQEEPEGGAEGAGEPGVSGRGPR